MRAWTLIATIACPSFVATADDPPIRVGDVIAQAIRTAETMESSGSKASALTDLAKVQARLGHIDDARATFRSAERATGEMRVEGGYFFHLGIARGQSVAGLTDEARVNRKRGMEWALDSPAAGSRLAVAAARSANEGDLDGAAEIVESLGNGSIPERIVAFAAIAAEEARRGEIERARTAMARAKGEADRAKESAKTSSGSPTYGPSLGAAEARLAVAEAKAGHLDEARKWIARVLAAVEEAPAGHRRGRSCSPGSRRPIGPSATTRRRGPPSIGPSDSPARVSQSSTRETPSWPASPSS